MEKITYFSIPIPEIRKLEPILSDCFGFSHSIDIIEELGQSYLDNIYNGGNRYEMPEFDYDKMMEKPYSIKIGIPSIYDCDVYPLLNKYLGVKNKDVKCAIFLITLLLFRNRRIEITDYESEINDYFIYVKCVRPEMLKLYKILHQPANCNHGEVRISVNGNPSIKLNNEFFWLTQALDDYLKKYLGVDSLDEADDELKNVYGKSQGNKLNDETTSLLIWGLCRLLQNSTIAKNKSISNKIPHLIYDYLIFVGLIKEEMVEFNTIRSRMNYLIGRFESINDLKKERIYKLSPNNNVRDLNFCGYF